MAFPCDAKFLSRLRRFYSMAKLQVGAGNMPHPVMKRVDAGCGCSYFVLMESDGKTGDRWLCLGDVLSHEVIVVRCPCGRSVEYPAGYLQRRYRLPSDMLVYDLQFRLR